MTDVNERQQQGWVFRKTKLSEEFDFADAQEKLPDSANMLLLIRQSGTLRFFTHAARPEPRAGDTIISYLPPQIRTPEEKAAKRAAKESGKGREGSSSPKPQAT